MKISYIWAFGLVALAALAAPVGAQGQDPKEPAGPDTVQYTPERGAVTFTHGKHAKQVECASCHHDSKPEKPLATPRQKCGACHTDTVEAPMKTDRKNAYHDTSAKEGVCYTCHKKETEAGKEAPITCSGCHKKPEQ